MYRSLFSHVTRTAAVVLLTVLFSGSCASLDAFLEVIEALEDNDSTPTSEQAPVRQTDEPAPQQVGARESSWEWVTPTIPSNRIQGISSGSAGAVAVGTAGTILHSIDGITWTHATLEVDSILDVAYGNGVYVAVTSDTDNLFIFSNDGQRWFHGSSAESVGFENTLGRARIVWTGARFLVVGSTGSTSFRSDWEEQFSSEDGTEWEYTHFSARRSLQDITVIGTDRVILTISLARPSVSDDGGQSWNDITTLPEPSGGNIWRFAAASDGSAIAVTHGSDQSSDSDGFYSWIATSDDGLHWETQHQIESTRFSEPLRVDGGYLIAQRLPPRGIEDSMHTVVSLADDGTFAYHGDIADWGEITRMIEHAGNVLALDSRNQLLTLSGTGDSIVFRPDPAFNGGSVSHVSENGQGQYVAAGSAGVFYSDDGVTWQESTFQDVEIWGADPMIGYVSELIWTGSEFILSAQTPGMEPFAWIKTSENGHHWERRSFHSYYFYFVRGVADSGNETVALFRFLTQGPDDPDYVRSNPNTSVFRFPDGIHGPYATQNIADIGPGRLFHTGGRFLSVADDGTIMTSTSGTEWTVVEDFDMQIDLFVQGRDRIVALPSASRDRNDVVLSSTDGSNWSTSRIDNELWDGVDWLHYADGTFFAGREGRLWTSGDGQSWSESEIPSGARVVYTGPDGNLYAAGENGMILRLAGE